MSRRHYILGKSSCSGSTLVELFEMFPDEDSVRNWLESIVWKDGVLVCHRYGGTTPSKSRVENRCRTTVGTVASIFFGAPWHNL